MKDKLACKGIKIIQYENNWKKRQQEQLSIKRIKQ